MKTLSDLKRQAANYTWEMTFNSWFNGNLTKQNKLYGLKRKVAKVKSNRLAFETPTASGLSWLDFPKAAEIEYTTKMN